MPETDENGKSKVENLIQSLYLVVENRVPENVVDLQIISTLPTSRASAPSHIKGVPRASLCSGDQLSALNRRAARTAGATGATRITGTAGATGTAHLGTVLRCPKTELCVFHVITGFYIGNIGNSAGPAGFHVVHHPNTGSSICIAQCNRQHAIA